MKVSKSRLVFGESDLMYARESLEFELMFSKACIYKSVVHQAGIFIFSCMIMLVQSVSKNIW